MAKPKSFKAELNPALQFISLPPEALEPLKEQEILESMKKQETTKATQNYNKQKSQGFSQNISNNQLKQKDEVPNGFKLNPQYLETKSKRLQLLMQPSLYEKVKAKAQNKGLSVNELIHSILDEHTDAS